MQSVSSRIWTSVVVSISYDDNNYTTGTSSSYKLFSYQGRISILSKLIWFGLIYWLNGISTFIGYLIPKPSLEKDSCGAIQRITKNLRDFIRFTRGISLKVTGVQTRLLQCHYAKKVDRSNALVRRVFTSGLGDQGSIQSRVRLNTQKGVLDTSLLYTQNYNGRTKGKFKQSSEKNSPLPNTLV